MKNERPPATMPDAAPVPPAGKPAAPKAKPIAEKPIAETGGPAGPEPTRYGDWERGGRCVDF